MMSAKILLLLGCGILAIAFVSARVGRDAPNPETPVTDFFEAAGKNFRELENSVVHVFGFENTEQVEQKAVERGKQVVSQLDHWANNIKKETESLKDISAIKDLRALVDKSIENFKVKYPGTAEDIKHYVEKTNKGTEEIINKIKHLGESEEAKSVKDLSQKLLDTAATTFKSIADRVKESFKK